MTNFYDTECECKPPTAEEVVTGCGEETDYQPKTVWELARLVDVKFASELNEDERVRSEVSARIAKGLKPQVAPWAMKKAYVAALVKCPHFREKMVNLLDSSDLPVGGEEEKTVVRRAVAQIRGVPFVEHLTKRSIIVGGESARMLAKVAEAFSLLSDQPGDLGRIVECIADTTFSHAVIVPEPRMWTEYTRAEAITWCLQAIAAIKKCNPFLKVTVLPMLSANGHPSKHDRVLACYDEQEDDGVSEFRANRKVNGRTLVEHLRDDRNPSVDGEG